jgi:glycerol-3-phosphate acyltransferase PlsY
MHIISLIQFLRIWIVLQSYLLGSIPFGYLLVRFYLKDDIRSIGSGNIGATNVIRTGSKKLGIATLLLDLGKGFLAVWLAHFCAVRWGYNPQHATVAAAVAVTIGHIFPIWLKFKGGKGVATGLGVFLALAPMAALCSLGVFVVVILMSRYVSLSSIVSAAIFPFLVLAFYPTMRDSWSVAGVFFLPLLVIVKHEGNIRRLLSGTEHRFGRNKAQETL